MSGTVIQDLAEVHRGYSVTPRDFRTERRLNAQRQELRNAAMNAFAELNGWRRTDRVFSTKVLAAGKCHDGHGHDWNLAEHEFEDHAEHYRERGNPYRSAAILAHLYNHAADVEGWGRAKGLQAHVPPLRMASWYFPDRCLVVAYTRPGVTVRWLPEQEAGPA